MSNKERLDTILYRLGLVDSRRKAQAEIIAGNVLVNENPVTKPGTMVDSSAPLRIREKSPYVGRGALKLIHALDIFHIDVKGRIAADIGSSTGGFTQVLLERGARLVYAVDAGTNQLDWKLRSDTRVVTMENTNARYIDQITFNPLPELAVVDVSFISLTKILDPLIKVLKKGFEIITLLKPQFELDRTKIGRRGLVKEEFRKIAVESVIKFAGSIGLDSIGIIESPITGAKSGNVEYLVLFKEKSKVLEDKRSV